MKAAPFELVVPGSVDETIAWLVERGDTARVMAGGQSLMPLLAMRRTAPATVVDLHRISALDHTTQRDDRMLAIGTMTTQRTVERSAVVAAHVRLLRIAVPLIAHVTVRNQGTLGGSIAHADPSAELPTVALATDATMVIEGGAGRRSVGAADFFVGAHSTVIRHDELLVEVRFPVDEAGSGWAFEEVGRRPGDVAIVCVAAMVRMGGDGRIVAARIALGAVAATPIRSQAAEAMLVGEAPSTDLFAAAGAAVAASIDPPSDLNGTGRYRRHLAAVLVRRALARAAERASR